MLFWTIWWVWLCFALVLAILEVAVSGFIFLGFAIGAVIVALLILVFGLLLSLPLLLLIFAALSLVAWLLLRRSFSTGHGQVRRVHHDIND
ncbi:NfeD family protein [Albibacillus kandeliae]|uniref:NfeD family protein n=1 Tax=Albibacillus kandeliae TaxID=2174228 RepID=UPI000D686E68|nr:hypothetical protein [Albibacillus kandeliae]